MDCSEDKVQFYFRWIYLNFIDTSNNQEEIGSPINLPSRLPLFVEEGLIKIEGFFQMKRNPAYIHDSFSLLVFEEINGIFKQRSNRSGVFIFIIFIF